MPYRADIHVTRGTSSVDLAAYDTTSPTPVATIMKLNGLTVTTAGAITAPTMTAPVLGVATGTSLAVTGALTSSGGGVGYATGAGGAVTQLTNRSTAVTLSKLSGTITTDTTSLAALAVATFTVTNTLVAIGDVVVVSQRSGATNTKTDVRVTAVAAGTFNLSVHNIDATTAEIGAIIINYLVLKAVSA